MKSAVKATIALPLLLAAAGCGNFNSVYRTFSVDDRQSVMVDVKQRAVLVASRTEAAGAVPYPVVCAEVSPDAMSAYAAELAANVDTPSGVAAGLAAASQEAAAYIGNRTHTIQLLRDGMYRLCEAYMNKALTADQFDTDMRRYQKYMVALMGIEQLTGIVRTPPMAISTDSQASAALSIPKVRKELAAIDARLAQLDEESKGANLSDKRKAEVAQEITDEKKNREDLGAALKNMQGAATGGKATVEVFDAGNPDRDALVAAAVTAVHQIMLAAMQSDETVSVCLSLYRDSSQTNSIAAQHCKEDLGARLDFRTKSLAALLDEYKALNTLQSPDANQLARLNAVRAALVANTSVEQAPSSTMSGSQTGAATPEIRPRGGPGAGTSNRGMGTGPGSLIGAGTVIHQTVNDR
ncbi:hypothetical protein CAL15_14395 [Bordetella genomosp. 13]|uniref:Lipoprotein n=1 Tax=Bordetella genomosp. 13 TaxID=463040 RepID=A0A1W6ZDP2_9BORD|nr:hypothetical protein CAL15_14395 [Bordetella genomosp. 13]